MVLLAALLVCGQAHAQTDPLPSWNEGPAKQAIVDFVRATTDKAGPKFVPPEARIATFDNDGTLWVEQPIYTQVVFAIDRVVVLAPKHPEWKAQEPFKTILSRDRAAMAKFTIQDIEKIIAVTHSGMTVEAFAGIVKEWVAGAKHPRFKRPYTDLVYEPMLEVMTGSASLRSNNSADTRRMSKGKHRKQSSRDLPAKPRGHRPALIAATVLLALGIGAGGLLLRVREPGGTGSPEASPAAQRTPASAMTAAGDSGFAALNGRWLRLDGGYVLEIRAVDAGGTIDAAYFNPQPINVARAEATRDGSALKVFVELQAPNYPRKHLHPDL
jgi:hypothetical protein